MSYETESPKLPPGSLESNPDINHKLLATGFIQEVSYLDWLANIMVVPMKEGTWRMCADYTNLNDACPNDRFSLPRIDQIFYSTFGNGMFSFLDNFFEYHQIFMFHFDKEKTVFSTLHRLYCYNVMSFRLKNAGATYQRLMTKIFKPLMGWTMEMYINDIVIKSKTRAENVQYLKKAFGLMLKYNMKLNSLKCAFGVNAGKFLGFLVTQ